MQHPTEATFKQDSCSFENDFWENEEREQRQYDLRREMLEDEINSIIREESSFLGRLERMTIRFLVRTARIAVGAALGAAGYWAGSVGYEKLDVPFQAQSLVGLGGGAFLFIACFWLFGQAITAAFGSGPTLENEHNRILEKAQLRLSTQERWKILGGR